MKGLKNPKNEGEGFWYSTIIIGNFISPILLFPLFQLDRCSIKEAHTWVYLPWLHNRIHYTRKRTNGTGHLLLVF
jgi:hypothetical protein